ncbi:hypothetical protein AV530_010890 [Patagioenas fasciata monilis]|uniref:Cytidine and dCMP deaminase domain-containing protein 1 n=1 Tax=Patagioenas fasciata monilis TaxID=372326 RepID=A0A1V4K841_PATFA|nr:hypothetical protein AV530_010890 [Patagioenas fasciata monilis]
MHPWMRLEKKDLYMFLARLMEEFPECHALSDEFNKTVIVICESDRVQKIVAMSFSKPGLHAIEQIIHCLPSSLRNCTVYLSRKPCTTCATFLIQGSVSSVYYWPMTPEKKGDEPEGHLDDLKKTFNYHEAGNAGIVVCEASKPKRIIALGCTTKELHAVPKVLLRFPNALKGCEVYMSRKPCNYCAILLVQAQVSQVYYWPNIETNMAEKDKKDHVDAIFTESYVVAATYVPTIDDLRKMQILNSNRRASSDDGKIESVLDKSTLQRFNLGDLKEKELEEYKNTLSTAEHCFKHLTSCKDEEIMILEDKESTVKKNCEYTHALQLCDLLASRSGCSGLQWISKRVNE